MQEIWMDIEGYEGLYQISNLGNVKRLERKINDYRGVKTRTIKEKSISPFDNGKGYLSVTLTKNKNKKNYYIHRLVAFTYLSNPNQYHYVNHLDYNTKNNNINNLEICTQKNNVNYSAHKMKHRNSIFHSSTNEKYIYYRKSTNVYRVIVDKKEYSTYRTLEEAVKKRDEIINGEN